MSLLTFIFSCFFIVEMQRGNTHLCRAKTNSFKPDIAGKNHANGGLHTLPVECGGCGARHPANLTSSLQESGSASAPAADMRDGGIRSGSGPSEAAAWLHTYARAHACRETAFESQLVRAARGLHPAWEAF